nr:Chain B, PGC1 LXXLL motif [synthetic construct]
PSLLKKLLLAP